MHEAGRLRMYAAALATIAGVFLACPDLPAPMAGPKPIKITLTLFRGSRVGNDYVDPKLGDAGDAIKKKLKLKRIEFLNEASIVPPPGVEGGGMLGENMKVVLKIAPAGRDTVHILLKITRGDAQVTDVIINTDQKLDIGRPGWDFGKIEKDVLVLMMVATYVEPGAAK